MKLSRIAIIVLAVAAPSAHAQMNQIFNALQSAQSAIAKGKQLVPQPSGSTAVQDPQAVMDEKEREAKQYSDAQAAAAQAQGQAKMKQQMQEQRESDLKYGIGTAGDPEDQAKIQAGIRRDAERQQQDAEAAEQAQAACTALQKAQQMGLGAAIVTCKNKGVTEQQMLVAFGGGIPMAMQAYGQAIVQDIYEDDVTDSHKGNVVSDYYIKCYRRGTTCARPAW